MYFNEPIDSGGMIFSDYWIDDDIIRTLETIVNFHITRNYKEVRNIIFGYDSKNDIWISKYGKGLDKKLSEFAENFLPSTNPDNFMKQGMMFYEDEVYNNIRFHVDESIKRVLDLLFTYSDKVVEYKHVIDIMISEWNLRNVKNGIISTETNTADIYGNLYFYQLEVREKAWRELRSISRHKGLMVRDSLKQAVVKFLENRSEMIKNSSII
jgi:hypothetical protein